MCIFPSFFVADEKENDANADASSITTVERSHLLTRYLSVPGCNHGRQSPSVMSIQSDAESCFDALQTDFPARSPDSDGEPYGKASLRKADVYSGDSTVRAWHEQTR